MTSERPGAYGAGLLVFGLDVLRTLQQRLVDDWRQAWRWASVRLLALSLALQGALLVMPDTVRAYLPDWAGHATAIFLLLAATVGRLVKQKPPDGDDHGSVRP